STSTSVFSLSLHVTGICSPLTVFFFTAPQTTQISTLSLHDALPISFERTFDRCAGNLAVALRSVTVARGEERAVVRDRQEQRRPGDQQLAVDVASPPPRRDRRPLAGLVRRHADHTEERRQPDRRATVARRDGRVRV